MPAAEVAWRVVLDTAEPLGEAEVQERALGFALANRAAVLVDDAGTGTQTRLAPDEAVFVAAGSRQRRSSLDGADAEYYRLALVPARTCPTPEVTISSSLAIRSRRRVGARSTSTSCVISWPERAEHPAGFRLSNPDPGDHRDD
jgi:hypothetical protein